MSITNKVTPYYEFNLDILKMNFFNFKESITDFNLNGIIAYSIKANYNRDIILTLNKFGSYFEVCSDYEILRVCDYGISTDRLIINGFITNKDLLLKCINNGALVIIGSINDLLWISSYKFDVPIHIGLRLNLDHIKKGNEYFSFESRFGISLENNLSLLKLLKNKNIYIKCLQSHFSGNTRSPQIYLKILEELLRIKIEHDLDSVSILDIGGGYKISSQFWQFKDYIKKIATLRNQLSNLQIIFEPGNCIVRTVGSYHTTVIDTFKINQKRYVLVDGSSIHLNKHNRNINYDYSLKFNNKKRNSHVISQIIVGNSCKESDIIMILKNENSLEIGDNLIIKNVGAYTYNEITDFILEKPNVLTLSE